MACNTFFRISKTKCSAYLISPCIPSTSQITNISYKKEVPTSHVYCLSTHKQYSTLLSSRLPLHKTWKRRPVSNISSVAFLSTIESDKFHIVVSNPSETLSTVSSEVASQSISTLERDFTSSLPVGNLTEGSISSVDISNVAASLSTDAAQLVEPTLQSLGLCNNTPVGAVQMFLEYLHIGWDMPWWIAIAACTVAARIILLPILIKTQRNAITTSNYMPQLQYLQAKFGEARKSGNTMEAAKVANEMNQYMQEHKISPLKNAMMPLLQAPIFISFFMALRAMAKVPVESMKTGGIWWAADLTIPDPYYILPLVSCGTLYVVLKVGAESGVKMENMQMAKYVLQAIPVIALPFCINFPAAVLYYWVTTNFCTLAIVSVLKIKPVRRLLNLPTPKPVDPKFVMPKKGFIKGMKESYEDQKVLGSIEERRRIDEMRFRKAGTGPVPRTYSYDPTKPRPLNAAISAKQHKP